ATVRHRTMRSKGCLSNKTALAMIFKLSEAAERNWRRLNGHNQLPKIILGIKFSDGIEVVRSQAQTAAACSLPSPKFGNSSIVTAKDQSPSCVVNVESIAQGDRCECIGVAHSRR